MTDERVVDEIVTEFLFDTCRLSPRLSNHAVEAAVWCAIVSTGRLEDNVDVEIVPLISGSVAEFYIQPMLPNVGDVDIMYYFNTHLAIPRGQSPPTQLPGSDFHKYVKVYEIIDSHLPCYAYLELRYLLTKCTDSDRYNVTEYEGQGWFLTLTHEHAEYEFHGPALMPPRRTIKHFLSDLVICIRCLSWPPQATDWPSRQRNYGWPDSSTVDHVVSNGCDLVQVAHRHCRQDEQMSKRQWRLSFSRAEIALLNSWMPIQQIVYHVLRVFMKSEQLTEIDNNSEVCMLSNYHIKTLMLWACELKPKSWWTLSLTRICVELLHTLAVWLTESRCPHYFISNCNLVDKSFDLDVTASRLLFVNEKCLSTWFVNYYLRQCAGICPESVSRLFDDVSTNRKLADAVSAVVDCRQNTMLVDSWQACRELEFQIAVVVSSRSVTARSCVCWMNELAKIDSRFCFYFVAVVFLHVANKIESCSLTEDLMKALSVTISEFVVSSNFYIERTFLLLQEDILNSMNSACCNRSELVQLVWQSAVELLKMFRHFEAQVFGSVATIVTTDFEALYAYKHGDYQRCLQLSTQNARTLRSVKNTCEMTIVPTIPEFIRLMDDDDHVRLLMPWTPFNLSRVTVYNSLTQLTLSLYLKTQCQSKLRQRLTSVTDTRVLISIDQIQINHEYIDLTMKHSMPKLTECNDTGETEAPLPHKPPNTRKKCHESHEIQEKMPSDLQQSHRNTDCLQTYDVPVRSDEVSIFQHCDVTSLQTDFKRVICGQLNLKLCVYTINTSAAPSRSAISQQLQQDIYKQTGVQTNVKICTVRGDGNCLFRALSLAITGSEHQHPLIRFYIVNHMLDDTITQNMREIYQRKQSNTDFRNYLINMKNIGTWGTDQEIVAAANLLNCSIICYSKYSTTDQFCLQHFPPHFPTMPLCTSTCRHPSLYLINSSGSHYESATVHLYTHDMQQHTE